MLIRNNQRLEWWKNRLASLLVIGWVSFVCGCYLYFYLTDVYEGYPVLQEIGQIGVTGLIRRLITP